MILNVGTVVRAIDQIETIRPGMLGVVVDVVGRFRVRWLNGERYNVSEHEVEVVQ